MSSLTTKHGFISPIFGRIHSIDIIDAIIASSRHIKYKKILTKRYWRNGKIVAEIYMNKHLVIITKNGKIIDAKLVEAGVSGNFYERVGIIIKGNNLPDLYSSNRCIFKMKGGCYTILEQTEFPEKVRIFTKGVLI